MLFRHYVQNEERREGRSRLEALCCAKRKIVGAGVLSATDSEQQFKSSALDLSRWPCAGITRTHSDPGPYTKVQSRNLGPPLYRRYAPPTAPTHCMNLTTLAFVCFPFFVPIRASDRVPRTAHPSRRPSTQAAASTRVRIALFHAPLGVARPLATGLHVDLALR